MTYRERRLRKAERLREWAEKRKTRSAAAFKTAATIADGIPMGQPILVGHHSEKRHRADIARIDNGMRKGIEHEHKAADMTSRAANIEAAADDAIYSDDPDAIEQLRERVEALEARRQRMKAENAAYRKGDPAYAALMGISVEAAAHVRAEIAKGYSWCQQPHPAYSLQNLGGNISRQRKRIEKLERQAKAEQSDCAIEFPSKPSEAVRTVLKARGWRWSGARGVWYHADTPDARHFAAYVNEHGDVPPGAAEFTAWIAEGERRKLTEGATPAQAAAIGDVLAVMDAGYQAMAEDRDPIAAVAEAIARAEESAPAIAEVPYALTPVIGRAGGQQGGLF